MYYLIDCNQFFVSCEQLFAPKLRNRPVVVLSSNDGCIVARSKEAKALGIPMGAPAFQWKEALVNNGVVCLSSNFSLYADMSQRVMEVLERFSADLEVYSIDEAFLQGDQKDPVAFASEIRSTVLRWTGIPVSIGIGKTKTLSKLCSDLAKKKKEGVFLFEDEAILKTLPVDEVWGVGRRLKERFAEVSIFTAWDLANAEPSWLKKQFSVAAVRTALELKGTICFGSEESAEEMQSSILRSRSFGRPVTALDEIKEALAMHTAKAAEKLREQSALARVCTVFLVTTQFYSTQSSQTLESPTSYTPHLIAKAQELLTPLFRQGTTYRKVGICLSDLVSSAEVQGDFWQQPLKSQEKQKKAMNVVDEIKRQFGGDALRFAAEGTEQPWKMKQNKRSPRYTTSWEELLEIN